MKRRFVALFVLALLTSACASHMPPNLSPQAQASWKGTKVIHAIDVIRDVAEDGTKTTPPVISSKTATRITVWHRSALVVIHNAPQGWQTTVLQGLTEIEADMPAAERSQVNPYIELAKTVLKEVTQ